MPRHGPNCLCLSGRRSQIPEFRVGTHRARVAVTWVDRCAGEVKVDGRDVQLDRLLVAVAGLESCHSTGELPSNLGQVRVGNQPVCFAVVVGECGKGGLGVRCSQVCETQSCRCTILEWSCISETSCTNKTRSTNKHTTPLFCTPVTHH